MNVLLYLLGVMTGFTAFALLTRAERRLSELEKTVNVLIDTANDLNSRVDDLEPEAEYELALTA